MAAESIPATVSAPIEEMPNRVTNRRNNYTRGSKILAASFILGLGAMVAPTVLAQVNTLMKDFSLNTPFKQAMLDAHWYIMGTAVPNHDMSEIFLNVGVPGRVSYLMSRRTMPSENFEVSFKVSVKGDAPGPQSAPWKQGFAFWYVEEDNMFDQDLTDVLRDPIHTKGNTFGIALERVRRDLIGYKSKFKGLATIFTTRTVAYENNAPTEKFEEAVIAATNDGTKSLYTDFEIPSTLASKIQFRNTETPIECKVRVMPDSVTVEIHDGKQWHNILRESAGLSARNGRLGFSGWIKDYSSMGAAPETKPVFDTVRIHDITVINHSDKVTVTDTEIKDKNQKPGEQGDLLYEHGAMKEHREESAAIHQLTNMVMKLIAETEPIRLEMEKTITSLSQRITSLEKIFVDLKQEINDKTGHDLDKEFEDIKKELLSLTEVATTETERRKQKMQDLHQDLEQIKSSGMEKEDIDKLTESNDMVLQALSTGHRWSFFISCLAVFLILAAGLTLFHRFRKWEKKHIL